MRRRLRDGRDGRALVEELARIGDELAPAARSNWFLELGVACEMLVPERQRALEIYQRAVELDPKNAEALDRGRMVCRELGRIDEYIRLCEIDLEHERDAGRKEPLCARIGEALLDLGNRERAAAFLVGAAGAYPASLPIQDALSTAGYDDDWQSEVDRLIELGEDADPEPGARVSLRAARILRMQSPEDPRCEDLLLRTLDYDPYNDSAHQLLDRLYAAAGRFDDLDWLQNRLVGAFPGVDEQAALCQRFSFSWIARGQHEHAARWCWRAIELGRVVYPIAGMTLLRGIYASRRRWDELLAAIDAMLATPLDEDAEVHISLLGGTIAWKAKSDLPRANSFFDRVRRVAADSVLLVDFDDALADERNPEVLGDAQLALCDAARRLGKTEPTDRVVEAWKRAIAADPSKRAPRRALARVLYRAERWRTLADVLKDEEAHACRDDAERVALLMQLAALYRDRLRQDLLRTATLERVVELMPANLAALDQLETAYVEMRRPVELARVLEKKLAHVVETEERVELYLRLVVLYRDDLGKEAEALRESENALGLDPTLAGLAEWLVDSYTRRREWDKLYALKQKQAALIEDAPARLTAFVELAQLATDKLKKPSLATPAWAEVLAIDRTHEAALTQLERLYAAQEEWDKLADIFTRRAEATQPVAAQLAYLPKLAQVCAAQLGQPERAVAAWRRVLDLGPRDEQARRSRPRAVEALKQLYLVTQDWRALEVIFSEERRLHECARLFEKKAAELESVDARIELWLRAGRIFRDQLLRRVEAQHAFEEVLRLQPAQQEAVETLVSLYEESGDKRSLAAVLALELDYSDGDAPRRERLLRLAELHARDLSDAAGAFEWQLAAFELDPSDAAVRAELERLAGASGHWTQLIASYERLCDAGPGGIDRVALLAAVAREKENLGDVSGALTTWQALAREAEPPPAALEALLRIHEAQADWQAVHDVNARKLALTTRPGERRAIVSAMAAAAEKRGDDERATSAYQRLWDEFGADEATLEALERLYDRKGALDKLEIVLVERLSLSAHRRAEPESRAENSSEAAPPRSSDGRRVEKEGRRAEPEQRAEGSSEAAPPRLPVTTMARTALSFRLAEVRRRLGRIPEALALYAAVLDTEPQHRGAQAALESIVEGEHRLEAARLLEPIVRATAAVEWLRRVLRIFAEHAADAREAVRWLTELAEIEEEKLGDRDAAFATLAEALRTMPSHEPTFDALERLCAAPADWERLGTLYKEVAKRPLAIAEHIEVRCRLGAFYAERLADNERALATFRRVLDLAPEDARPLRALARLDADDNAIGFWEKLRAVLPDDPEALAALAALYERLERWQDLAGVLERQLEGAGAEMMPMLLEQQAMVFMRLGLSERAETTWRRLSQLRAASGGPE